MAFVENSRELKSEVIIRFLDDFYFFSNRYATLEQDVLAAQHLLADHALYLNSEKTRLGSSEAGFFEHNLDDLKKSLLEKREQSRNYDEDDTLSIELADEEADYLSSLLEQEEVAEEDVELALSLLQDDDTQVDNLLSLVFNRYPHLMKNLHRLFGKINDPDLGEYFTEDFWWKLEERLKESALTEFELFWLVRLIIDQYLLDRNVADMLLRTYSHPSATPIVKSAVLEIRSNDFGFAELKERQLREAPSGILGIAAAFGFRSMEKARRNQCYQYVSKHSKFMQVICDVLSSHSSTM